MEATKPTLTGVKKRQQIQNANRMVFIWVTCAAAVIAIAAVLLQVIYKQFAFNNAIIGNLMTTNATLTQNIKNYDELKNGVARQLANDTLSALRTDPSDSPLQVVIDALPTTSDNVALLASLQQVILPRSGVKVDMLSVDTENATAPPPALTQTVALPEGVTAVPIHIKVSGSYDALRKVFDDLHNSIRPIKVTNVKITGTVSNLTAEIMATTYYATPSTVDLKQEQKKP